MFSASGSHDFHAHCTVDRTILMLCVEVISSICLDWIYLTHAGNLVPTVYVAWGVGQPASGNALCHVWFEMEADSSPKHHVMLTDCNCSSNLWPVFEVLISTHTDEVNSLLWGTCLQADDGDTVNMRGRLIWPFHGPAPVPIFGNQGI